ncbi:hypothetical protein [Demequina sp.]|uniref:hypothetical protein n=1 Tax=Demequina sp. TaxID=2050685 RepID=UPI0025C38F02|nr:hypothetical protein [Demequina sp.]
MGTESRLGEYQTQAEHLHGELVGITSSYDVKGEPVIESSLRVGDTHSGTANESDPAYWQIADNRSYVETSTAVAAGEAMSDFLVSDGWVATDGGLSNERATVTDLRKSIDGAQWHIRLVYPSAQESTRTNLAVLIMSPWTTRGTSADG